MIHRSTQNGRHAFSERKDDLYETPDVAVNALLSVETFEGAIWECASGRGAIVDVLRNHGYKVFASDLVDYGRNDALAGVDFLMERKAPDGVQSLITNPPYKLATEFVEHALDLGIPKIAMLMRLAFLESERRSRVLDGGKLAKVYVFKNRLPFMHRDDWDGPKATNAVPFCWCVWEQNWAAPTILSRISA